MTGRPNNRNYNRQNGFRGQLDHPRAPTPPPIQPDDPPRGRDDEDLYGAERNPDLYWYYGQGAGGMVLSYRAYYGKKINEVPLTYLKWCYDKLQYATVFRSAFEVYSEGLRQWIRDGNHGEIVVPMGHTYKGEPLRKCRDKEWMKWLRGWTSGEIKRKHDVFFLAIDEWIKHPRHQNAIRDIGELLPRTKYEDDLDLEGGEYDDRDADEVDEKGNLKGFVVPDDQPDPNADCSESNSLGSESEESARETDDSEDEVSDVVDRRNKRGYLPTPAPETPKKRRRSLTSSEGGRDSDAYDGPPSNEPHTLSLRSGKIVTLGTLPSGPLSTPPPESSRKRKRTSTPTRGESNRSNTQLQTPASPHTPIRKFKRPRHKAVILSDEDDDDDDDDTPLDQVRERLQLRKLSHGSPSQTPSKPSRFSSVGLDGSPMKRLFHKTS